jgi:hypothetical protein
MTSAARADLLARVSSAALGTALLGFAGWLAWLNLRLPSRSDWIFWAPVALCVTTMGLLCWWTALGGQEPATRARVQASWRGGWLVGMAGFVIGFLGPLLVMPRANLGPLLGILITGPLAFVLGALGGGVLHKGQQAG